MRATVGLWVAVARSSFRRYSTYRAATLAGIFTNCVFGAIICYTYIAVWRQNPDAGGYDVTDALTYAWLGQAMIMTVAVWSGGATDDLAARIRSGDVAIDLYRPVGLLGWYLASDLGRALYHLLTRGLAPTIVGAILFDLRYPGSSLVWAQFAVARRARRHGQLRHPDARVGERVLAARRHRRQEPRSRRRDVLLRPGGAPRAVPRLDRATSSGCCRGRRTCRCRPTSGSASATAATPGRRSAFQVVWAAVVLALAQGVLRLANRRVVVQGG